jgi:ACS family glucarate transporter-like MFS transporter
MWWFLVRDRVRQIPWVNETEAVYLEQGKIKPGPTPWGKIWRHRSTWFLTASYSFQGYVSSVYIFWMFLYITLVRHVPLVQGAWFATLPPVTQLIMAPIGGFASDWILSRTHNRTLARRSVAMVGMFLTAALVLIGAFTTNTTLAIAILALGAGFLWLATSMFWAAASDLAGPNSAAVSSIMNTGANAFSFFGPTVTPLIGQAFGYEWALVVVAISAVASGLLWLGVELREPISA